MKKLHLITLPAALLFVCTAEGAKKEAESPALQYRVRPNPKYQVRPNPAYQVNPVKREKPPELKPEAKPDDAKDVEHSPPPPSCL